MTDGPVCGTPDEATEGGWGCPAPAPPHSRKQTKFSHGALWPAAAPRRVSLRLTEIKFPWAQVPNSAVLFLLKCNCFSPECEVTARRQEDV